MKMIFAGSVAGLMLAGAATNASANEFEPALRDLATSKIQQLVADPTIIAAIQAQNQKNAGLGQGDIDTLDQQWRAEVGSGSSPTIDPVMQNAVAEMLRAMRDDSEGLFTEIFVMDNHGLNVAASDTTSDYWQGDEAKWQQTYSVGADAVHISEVELDDSTQSYQAQVSVSIADESGAPIGAATFGVNIEYLE